MAQATLREMAREVQQYSGGVLPILLAERFIRDRYRKACEKSLWSFKIGRGQLFTENIYNTGTVTLTKGDATVTGSGTTFTSGMVGRQFRSGGFVYTIDDYTSPTSIELDRDWQYTTQSGSLYDIVTSYLSPSESDFHAFVSIIDPARGWRLRTGYTVMDLDIVDPRRAASSTPVLLAGMPYNGSTEQYELWPNPTSNYQYPYIYEKRIADLSAASDTPFKIIRSDILVKGALADLARWPGTPQEKNPFYDPYFNQWKSRENDFDTELDRVMVEDQNILLTDYNHYSALPYAPLDAKFFQNHAFPAF